MPDREARYSLNDPGNGVLLSEHGKYYQKMQTTLMTNELLQDNEPNIIAKFFFVL